MSNAVAAYYAYLAQVDREKARVFRNFGYFASANYVSDRAARYQRRADMEALSDTAPADESTGAARLPSSNHGDSLDSDLHTTSNVNEQTGLFAEQEPPA